MRWNPIWMLAAVLVLAGLGAWFFSGSSRPPPAPRSASAPAAPPPAGPAPSRAALPAPPPPSRADCADPRFAGAAAANAASLATLPWAPFGRAEVGWETYAPVVAREVSTACAPTDPGFAAALARWQAAHKMAADGVLTPQAFEVMRVEQHRRRPFVAAFVDGCPVLVDEARLAPALKDEGYSGKPIQLRRDVLDAYRRMVAAARAEVPAVAADRRLLTIFSGYRGPAEEAARCADRDCTGPTRVRCSPHRTGTAIDMYVGEAPGHRPDSSDDANRLWMSKTPVYRWLVLNASRFGFTPYVFEPWHWEYVLPPS